MTVETMTLTDFLLARIAEDAHAAGLAWSDLGWEVDGQRILTPRNVVAKVGDRRTADFIVRNRPARVLAECEAKRRIVDVLRDMEAVEDERRDQVVTLRWTCQVLALPYSDHPDYRPEWQPE